MFKSSTNQNKAFCLVGLKIIDRIGQLINEHVVRLYIGVNNFAFVQILNYVEHFNCQIQHEPIRKVFFFFNMVIHQILLKNHSI